MKVPVLWHFPISHYNEKARWALDWKGIAHERRALFLDYLPRVWWATGQGSLPVLWLDGRAIHDSTRIIEALEAVQPEPALYPEDPEQRRRALEIEEFFDEEVGHALRSVVVGRVLAEDPVRAIDILGTGVDRGQRRLAKAMAPAFRALYRRRHGIDPAAIEAGMARILAGLDRVEAEVGASGHLVGDAFSVADLTAAALLGPLVGPPELQYPPEAAFPDWAGELRASLSARPGFAWVLETYRRHRGKSAEVPG